MQHRKPHTGPPKLVLAFDIGTTYSSVSYCILKPNQVPEVLTVERFPAQGVGHTDAKVPSLLYYDKTGTVRAAGAEVLARDVIEKVVTEEWSKAESWKLHLCPEHSLINLSSDLPPFPSGKSAVDVLADFIKYLFNCSKTHIQECHPAFPWSFVEDSIEYIFTYPGGWAEQRSLYFRAIERAGLVPSVPEGQPRVHMMTEGEAGLHLCTSHILGGDTFNHAVRQGVVVIDAGGGIINLSMFSMTSDRTSWEEIAPAESRLQGSVFVTHRARTLIERKLDGWDHSSPDDIARVTLEFDQTTKRIIESDREPAYIKVASRRINSSEHCISSGQLRLSGDEATGLFSDSVEAIIDAFEQQQKFVAIPITTVFLVGGLSTNEWVSSQLQSYFTAREISIHRPDKHAHKVVAHGAMLSHVYHESQSHLGVTSAIRGSGCVPPVRVIDENPSRRETTSDTFRPNGQMNDEVPDGDALCPVHQHILSAGPQSAHRKYDIVRALSIKGNKLWDLWRTKTEKADLEMTVETSNDRIAHLEKTVTELQDERDGLYLTIQSLRCETLCAQGLILDAARNLIEITNALGQPAAANKVTVAWVTEFTPRCVSALETMGDKALDAKNIDEAVSAYSTALSIGHSSLTVLNKWARIVLLRNSGSEAWGAAVEFKPPKFVIARVICDTLEGDDRITEAVACYRHVESEVAQDQNFRNERVEWELDFQRRCVEKLDRLRNEATSSQKYNEATKHLSMMLSLNPPDRVEILVKRSKARVSMNLWNEALSDAEEVVKLDQGCEEKIMPLLKEWAKAKLTHGSWKDTIASATQFAFLRTTIYRVMCERLETIDYITDAVDCFHDLESQVGGENSLRDEQWAVDFSRRSFEKLMRLGDTAADAQRHDEAISHYTIALSINFSSSQDVLLKRSKAYLACGSLKHALDDANQVIKLHPSSPWGYEMKHAALHKVGDYDNAIAAFEEMLSKMTESPDSDIQKRCDDYVSPSSTQATIRRTIQRTTRHSPRVLINTRSGRLHDKADQVSAFEGLPIFNELVSSMTRRIDIVRIKREVREYFRYAMLSHKWEDHEPLFQQVVQMAVYDLEKSPTHDKLQRFCKIVRDAGLNWAWSDTCCVNKSDLIILQEALVAMFKWYQGSAMMVVFLRGVLSSSRPGALVGSIWNKRGWTLQEYIAAKVILFYTEDWTPYLDLPLSNHKHSPEIISEMEKATGVSAQQLKTLCPGLTSIRQKLRLASTRQTTLVEDAAYSLLGIFSVTSMHAIYGEGEDSLGRLLAHILSGSGDTSILDWTGERSNFNSFLPAHTTVFSESATSHLPLPIPDDEMERIIATPQASSFDLDAALRLYDGLTELSPPWFAAKRMKKLPCFAFELPRLMAYPPRSGRRLYFVNTVAFGMVEIRTQCDLSRSMPLFLIHPWLDTILGRGEVPRGEEHDLPKLEDNELSDDDIVDGELSQPEPEPQPVPTPTHTVPLIDRETRAYRLAARLKQPFGALLVTLAPEGRSGMDYMRVAADSLITVRFQENVSLVDLLDHVRTIDVL